MFWKFATSAACAALSLSTALAGTLIPVTPVPGSISTVVTGINDNNIIVGDYETPDMAFHGFIGALGGEYTFFDYPSGNTVPLGINNAGYAVGDANPTGDNLFGDTFERKPNGDLVPITRSGATMDGLAHGIVNNQKFVGDYWVFDGQRYTDYGYYGKGSKYKSELVLPFDTNRTRPRGLNNKGTVVGNFHDMDVGDSPGFVLKGGTVTVVRYPDPNSIFVFLEGVNDKGQIVGDWENADGTVYEAFLYDVDANAFKLIKVPGSTVSSAFGINKAGMVAVASDVGSYIYCSVKKSCPNLPGALHVADTWVKAKRDGQRWLVCKNGCMKPHVTVAPSSNAAALREAIKRDPMLAAERREPGLR